MNIRDEEWWTGAHAEDLQRSFGFHERHSEILPCVLQYGSKLEDTAKQIGLAHIVQGCFAKDRIPHTAAGTTAAYIVNMQSEEEGDKKGTHWVALVQFPHWSFYFDSMGVDPPKQVIEKARKPMVFNLQQVQDINSCQCGYYCLYFLYHLLVEHLSVESILAHFSDRVEDNDQLLNRFFCNHTACIVGQSGDTHQHKAPHRALPGSVPFGLFAPRADSLSSVISGIGPKCVLAPLPTLPPFIRSHR